MKLTEIQDAWDVDCKVDATHLGYAATRVPELHSKYLKLLTNTRLQFRKTDTDYLRLKQTKVRYYRGEMSKEELTEYGWDQFLLSRPLKNEMDDVLNSDPDIMKLLDKLEYLRTVVFCLEQILRSINSRTWDIKNAIEIRKFESGSF